MSKYVSTFRAVYDADDDVTAAVIADQIRLNAEADLDTDDGDAFECTQTTSMALDLTPDELFEVLKRARNLLINTRIKQCYQFAQEFDKIIYALQFRESPDFSMAGYDYGEFMKVVETILQGGTPDA